MAELSELRNTIAPFCVFKKVPFKKMAKFCIAASAVDQQWSLELDNIAYALSLRRGAPLFSMQLTFDW